MVAAAKSMVDTSADQEGDTSADQVPDTQPPQMADRKNRVTVETVKPTRTEPISEEEKMN